MSVPNPSDGSKQRCNQELPENHLIGTDRKNRRLEEELYRVRAELEQYRILYQNLLVLYFTLDPAGHILAINPLGAAQLRYVVTDLVGQPISTCFCPEDVPALQSAIAEALQRPQSVTFQGRQLCRDGQRIWVKATLKAIGGTQYDTIALLTCEDITATKDLEARCQQAEAEVRALRESEARWRSVIENAPDHIFTCDRNGKLLSFNHTIPELSVEQVIGTSIYDYIPPDYHSTLKTAFRQVFQTGKTVQYETAGLGVNEETAWYSSRVGPIWRDGQVAEAVVVCTDITERKQAEADLRQSQQQLETITANIPGAVYRAIYHADGQVSLPYVSEGSLTLYGFEAHELTTFSSEQILSVFHPDDLPKIAAELETRKQTLEPGSFEYRIISKSGEVKWIRDTASFRWNEQGDFIVDGVDIDITDLKHAEVTLKESEMQFRTLVGNIPGVVYRCAHTEEWHGMVINDAIETIVGYPASAFSSSGDRTFASIVHPDDIDQVNQIVEAAVQERQPFSLEYRLVHADGSPRWVDERGQGVFDAQGKLLYLDGVIFDISDRKRIEQERKQVEDALRESEERFRQLAENIQKVFWMASFEDGHELLYISPAYERIWQRSCESLYQHPKDWMNAIHSEDRDRVFTALATQIAGNYAIEYRIVRPDGSIRWIHDRAFPIQSHDGEVYRLAGIAEDITERKQTEVLLRQQAERERLLGDIAQRIRQSLDLNEILNTTVTEVRQVLKADRAIIFRFQPNWCGVVAVESVASPWSPISGSTIYDPCFAEAYVEQYRQGRVRSIENILKAGLGECHLQLLTQFQVKANLVVPILQGEHLWGLLIAHQCSGPRQWQPYEVDLLKQLATQVAIAIHQSELYQQAQLEIAQRQQAEMQLRKVNRALRVRSECNTAIVQATEEPALLQAMCDIITSVGGYRFSAISLINSKEQSQIKVMAYASDPEAEANLSSGIGLESVSSPVVTVMQTKRSCIIRNGPVYPNSIPQNTEQFRQGFVASLALPLLDHTQLLGVLTIHAAEPNAFDTEEVQWLTELANKLAYGLVSLRVREKQKQAEAVLQRQAQQERLMGAITQPIHQAFRLEEILNATVREVWQFLHADRVLIYRVWPDRTGSIVAEAVDPKLSQILGRTFAEEVLPLKYQELYQQGRIRAINDIQNEQVAPCMVEFSQQLGVKAKLIVPILYNSDLWGLLIAHQCDAPRQWQGWELGLLKQLATQLEIAIHQSQLVQQVQSLNNDLELQVQKRTIELRKAFDFEALLRRITDKVRDSLEENQILQTAVQELVNELQTYGCSTGLYDLNQAQSTVGYEEIRSGTGIPLGAGKTVSFSVHPELYHQLLQGQYLQFCSLPTFADPARLTDCPFTILACPILDDQKVIGDLWLYRPAADFFEDAEIRLIQQVANHCAIALRQSRLYQSAQAQVEELERLNHLKDDFLSTVSHELRTPVANIRMATQMLEINLNQLGILENQASSVNRYLHVMHEECQREINLINDLLDLTRIESETEPFIQASIDLSIWLSAIAESFLERAQAQQQQLMIDVTAQPLMLVTDIGYLERIITELLQNACKYTPAHETIRVTAQAQTIYIEICVSNTGVEIPEGELERVFDKFYRIPNSDPWKHGGTGLGLALVKRLVARLDGTITVFSHARQTTFTLRFPQS